MPAEVSLGNQNRIVIPAPPIGPRARDYGLKCVGFGIVADVEIDPALRRDEHEISRQGVCQGDGQHRQKDKPFDVGGYPLMFPGDPKGPARETINCYCYMTAMTEKDLLAEGKII